MRNNDLIAGLAGSSRHACVALASPEGVVGVCEQQCVTRVRGAGFNASGLPDDALDTLLERLGRNRGDIKQYVTAEADPPGGGSINVARVDRHLAHATHAFLSSPFPSAAIVVCDHDAPKVSVWEGAGDKVSRVDWSWQGPGFADLYSSCAALLGFAAEGGDQRLEALARTRPKCRDGRLTDLFTTDGVSLSTVSGWQTRVDDLQRDGAARFGREPNAVLAASLQGRIGELFLDFLAQVRRRTSLTHLCLSGTFFYHSSMNTVAKAADLFSDVFVPVDPGNGGLAVGAALHGIGCGRQSVTPFLGPAYNEGEVKAALDNCKLRYDWQGDDQAIDTAIQALRKGTLVAWFEGPKEWGPRALGGRSILANPFSPYVLENLNQFLKRREPWRGYALSALEEAVHTHFEGPDRAPFMECDYRPLDPHQFRHALPSPEAAIRVQSVGRQAPPRFRRLLEAFGEETGIPCLVNTSFNGFHEPMVCSPRDAVRVFYGSGVDMAVIEHFVLTK